MACAKLISQFEVLAAGDAGRRRWWTDEEKVRIVEESLRGHRQGSATARRLGISRSLLTRRRKEHRLGLLGGGAPARFSPVSVAREPPRMPSTTAAATSATETVDVTLVNGRRLTVSATIDPGVLGRLLEVLDRR